MGNNFQDAIKFIHLNRLDGFNIRSGTSAESMVFKYDDSESKEANITRAEQVMAVTPGRFFTLVGWCGKNQSRGAFQYQFSNEGAQQQTQPAAATAPAVGMIDEAFVNQRIETAIAGVRAEYERRDIEKREKELQEQRKAYIDDVNSVIGMIVQKVAPMIRAATQHQPQLAVGTVDNDQERQLPTQEQNQPQTEEDYYDIPDEVCEAILRWQKADPDYAELIIKIAALAEQQDKNYLLAKQML